MDTSKEYIEMCRKAVDIQKEWQPKIGDYIYRKYTIFGEEIDNKIWNKEDQREVIILTYQSSICQYIHATNENGETRIFSTQDDVTKTTSIWLPRQDQLQDMVDWKKWKRKAHTIQIGANGLYDKFYPGMLVVDSKNQVVWSSDDSLKIFEQLWLAFVMHEKYQKKWNGEEWA